MLEITSQEARSSTEGVLLAALHVVNVTYLVINK
jgi:hypothetical protein